MITVKNLGRDFNIIFLLSVLAPRKAQHCVNIVTDYSRLGAHGRHELEFADFFSELLTCLRGQGLFLNLGLNLLKLRAGIVLLAEFFLNRRHLLVEVAQLGVIFPADFTQDWHNERLNSKRRALGFDDEDEIDFAEVARNRGQQPARQQPPAAPEAPAENLAAAAPIIAAHASSPDAVRAPETDGKVQTMSEDDMASAISKAFVPPKPPAATNENNDAEDESDQSAFTPLPTESGREPIAAEDRAIESWKGKQLLAKQNEQLLEELRNEARAEGFQSGFREGEEKGLLSGQKNASQVFSKVSEILREFEGLKGLILDNVQKNFYELSQAIGEALLGREFSIKPESYATMIQRVIKDTVAPNEFKIRMHPDTWQKVHDLAIPDLDPHLIKDNSINPGEFRVESALTVVDVNAKKMVQQLLEKVDINLFDEKKAG